MQTAGDVVVRMQNVCRVLHAVVDGAGVVDAAAVARVILCGVVRVLVVTAPRAIVSALLLADEYGDTAMVMREGRWCDNVPTVL